MGRSRSYPTGLLASFFLIFLACLLIAPFLRAAEFFQAGKIDHGETYHRARKYFNEGKKEEARKLLRSLLKQQPDTSVARNAHYLLGKIIYQQGNAPLAAVKQFYRVYSQYPRSNLTDDALYFIAEIFIDQLDQPETAIPYLKAIKDNFSEADYHEEAVNRLESLLEDEAVQPRSYTLDNIPPPAIKLNFEKIELKDFISTYADLTGKNFMYRPSINGKVTLLGKQPIPVHDLFDVFIQVLEARGYTAVKEGGTYKVKRIKNARREGVPFGQAKSGLETRFYSLDGLPWNDLKSILSSFLPNYYQYNYLTDLDKIMITGRPDKLKETRKLLAGLKAMNAPPAGKKIISYSPKYVDVGKLAGELKNMLKDFLNQRSFQFIRMDNTNRLYVIVAEEKADFVRKMCKRLDKDIVDRLRIKVFRLEHASVSQVADRIKKMLAVLPGGFAGNKVRLVPDKRQKAIVVSSISQRIFKMISRLISQLDKPTPEAPKGIEVFKLKYSQPKEVVGQLRDLLLALPENYSKNDFKLIPDNRRQAVVASANSTEIFSVIERMLKHLDQKSPSRPENIRIFHLDHARVEAMAKIVNQIKEVLPGHVPESKIKVIADQRQQAIVVSAESRKVFPIVERIINELDKESTRQPNRHHVYKVHNISAGPLAEKLQFLFKGEDSKSDLRVTADEQTNSLIVSAPPDEFSTIKKMIKKLDSPKQQILVDVYIVEASADKTRQLGIQWGAEGEVTVSGSGRQAAIGTNLGLGSKDNLFGFNAGILSENKKTLLSVLHAYKTDEDFNILSTTHLMANENEKASISVGDVVPILKDSQVTEGGSLNKTYSFENVGIDLQMTPTLSGDSTVSLDINQKIEELQSSGDNKVFGAPTRKSRDVQTTVTVPDNITLVLGGVLKTKQNNTNNSVPYLSAIPGLGYLFASSSDVRERRNLLIFLTPHILRSGEEAAAITRQMRQEAGGTHPLKVSPKEFLQQQKISDSPAQND